MIYTKVIFTNLESSNFVDSAIEALDIKPTQSIAILNHKTSNNLQSLVDKIIIPNSNYWDASDNPRLYWYRAKRVSGRESQEQYIESRCEGNYTHEYEKESTTAQVIENACRGMVSKWDAIITTPDIQGLLAAVVALGLEESDYRFERIVRDSFEFTQFDGESCDSLMLKNCQFLELLRFIHPSNYNDLKELFQAYIDDSAEQWDFSTYYERIIAVREFAKRNWNLQ